MGGRGWHVPAKLTARSPAPRSPCAPATFRVCHARARTGAGVTSHGRSATGRRRGLCTRHAASFGTILTPPWVERARHCTDDQWGSSSGWVALETRAATATAPLFSLSLPVPTMASTNASSTIVTGLEPFDVGLASSTSDPCASSCGVSCPLGPVVVACFTTGAS
jgi:hypothetical protein